jgi:hypothetical protein
MLVALGGKLPSYSIVKNWVGGFRTGRLNTEEEECSGGPTQGTVPENVDNFHSKILDDRRISTKMIVPILAISQERVVYIIHKF